LDKAPPRKLLGVGKMCIRIGYRIILSERFDVLQTAKQFKRLRFTLS
jgi:hypothetical protein